jgi:3-phenylpropionate/trans-cinnamate dioxygenase ferredoxin subunit
VSRKRSEGAKNKQARWFFLNSAVLPFKDRAKLPPQQFTEQETGVTDFHPALAEAELADNDSRAVTINGSKVLICRAAGELYAVENRCTHQEAELEGGRIRGCFISCPLHGVRFDLRDGTPMGQLTREPLPTYELRVVDGIIEVAVA